MLNARGRLIEHRPQLSRNRIAGGKGAMASGLLHRRHEPLARDAGEWLDRHDVDPAIPRVPARGMQLLPEPGIRKDFFRPDQANAYAERGVGDAVPPGIKALEVGQ